MRNWENSPIMSFVDGDLFFAASLSLGEFMVNR